MTRTPRPATGSTSAERRVSLRRLAQLYGVQASYTDGRGQRRRASRDSILAALRALGAPLAGAGDLDDAFGARLRARWTRLVEPVLVAWHGRRNDFLLRLPAGADRVRAACHLRLADGGSRSWLVAAGELPVADAAVLDGTRYVARAASLPARLPPGYHRLSIELGDRHCTSLVIAAPAEAFDDGRAGWGGFLPLHALHSARSWGTGDFSDADALSGWLAERGGRTFASLPLLAAFLGDADAAFEPSPYLPVSRLFWNEIYVDPRRLAEFEHCTAARRLVESAAFRERVAALQSAALVDYRGAMALKRSVLELLERELRRRRDQRYESFRAWVRRNPPAAEYAAFRAVNERLGRPWPAWPAGLRPGRLQAARAHVDPAAADYHLYAQWAAAEQLGRLAANARTRADGLCLDFPVGVHPDGFDVWRHPALFAREVSTGAPPDALFAAGQHWSAPPLQPEAARRDGHAYFRAALGQHLALAGTLRLDHVMGLHRLFWIPRGADATDGVYVHYPARELYAIVCLESHRHRTRIVGENLGTVPRYVDAALARHRLAPLHVAQFGIRSDRARPLRRVPARSVAALNTHDTPTFAGFLAGRDIDDRAARGLLAPGDAESERGSRRAAAAALRRLRPRGRPAAGDRAALLHLCLEHLARSAGGLVVVNLEDLWLEVDPQNVPGTGAERPNWRRKARYGLEALTQLPAVAAALACVARGRAAAYRRTMSLDRPPAAGT